MIFPLPTEKAILTIRGQDFQEWETVSVKHTKREQPFYTFRVTCSEGFPLVQNLRNLQIIPGDRCTITLAGIPAFNGLVYSRQVFYDGTKHYIEIQGASPVLELGFGHVIHKSYEFNNKTIQQIIEEIVKPFGINFVVEGGQLPTDKIPNYNIAPGTTAMNAIETIIRSAPGAELSSNLNGDLVAFVGPTGGDDVVREGIDILEGREIIFNPDIYKNIYAIGQNIPNDQEWGAAAAQVMTQATTGGSGTGPSQLIMSEVPAWTKGLLTNRANMDRAFQDQDQVTVFITRQGWLRPSGGLWKPNQKVSVISPMLIMTGSEDLKLKSVTFTQDNSTGTRVVLELCNVLAMGQGIPQGGP